MEPKSSPFPPSQCLNNLGTGLLGNALCQISEFWASSFQIRREIFVTHSMQTCNQNLKEIYFIFFCIKTKILSVIHSMYKYFPSNRVLFYSFPHSPVQNFSFSEYLQSFFWKHSMSRCYIYLISLSTIYLYSL